MRRVSKRRVDALDPGSVTSFFQQSLEIRNVNAGSRMNARTRSHAIHRDHDYVMLRILSGSGSPRFGSE